MVKLLLTDDFSPMNSHVARCAATVLADLFDGPFIESADMLTPSADMLTPYLAAVSTPVLLRAVVQIAVGPDTQFGKSNEVIDGMDTTDPTDIQSRRECSRLLLAIASASVASGTAVRAAIEGSAAARHWLVSICETTGEGADLVVDQRLRGLLQRLQRVLYG
jgi:hypothetical protein